MRVGDLVHHRFGARQPSVPGYDHFRPRLLIVDLSVSDAEMDTVLREVSKQLWCIIARHSCFVLRRTFLVIIGSDNIALGELTLGRVRSRSREQ